MEGTAKRPNHYKLSNSNGEWPLPRQLKENKKVWKLEVRRDHTVFTAFLQLIVQSAHHGLEKEGKKGLLDGGHSKLGTIADLGLKKTGWSRAHL